MPCVCGALLLFSCCIVVCYFLLPYVRRVTVMFCFVALLTDAVLVYPDIVLGQAQDQLLKYLVSLSPEERADVMDVSGDGEWGQPILQVSYCVMTWQ